MPYQCRLERGRVLLIPAAERLYEILGGKSQQPFLHCASDASDRCRLRMLHRFDIACGGGRVPWLAVAAAAARHRGQDAFIERGRLHLGAPSQEQVSTDCFDAPWARGTALTASATGSFGRPCWPRTGERASARVTVFPQGFAPLNDIGARIVVGPARAQAPATVQRHVSATEPPVIVAEDEAGTPTELQAVERADPAADRGASAASTAGEMQLQWQPPKAAQVMAVQAPIRLADASAAMRTPSPWVVTVQQDEEPRRSREAAAGWPAGHPVWLLAVALGTLLLTAAWVATRMLPSAGRSVMLARLGGMAGAITLMRRREVADAGDGIGRDRAIAELQRTAGQLRSRADQLLDELKSAPPLRGVLRQELELISQRLSDVPAIADASEQSLRMARLRAQTGIRELHRVIKIAEGAAASFSGQGMGPRVPTSREEAFALLGVNDAASEATLKKLVDALRMSWHPDHARDDADRRQREERIKQINLAWDLIAERPRAV